MTSLDVDGVHLRPVQYDLKHMPAADSSDFLVGAVAHAKIPGLWPNVVERRFTRTTGAVPLPATRVGWPSIEARARNPAAPRAPPPEIRGAGRGRHRWRRASAWPRDGSCSAGHCG